MSLIKSKDTKLELIFFNNLKPLLRKGYRYRKHFAGIAGKPDLILPKQRIAIFLDGDFWHGYNFKKLKRRLPKNYWRAKIARNIERDKLTNAILKKSGWKVVRIWEHDVKKNPAKVTARVSKMIQNGIK